MAAEIAARRQTLEVGRIQKLFGSIITAVGYLYDVSLDGSRFIVAQEGAETGGAARPPLTLVENWTGLLTRRGPAGAYTVVRDYLQTLLPRRSVSEDGLTRFVDEESRAGSDWLTLRPRLRIKRPGLINSCGFEMWRPRLMRGSR